MKKRLVKKAIKKYLNNENLNIKVIFGEDFAFDVNNDVLCLTTEKGDYSNLKALAKKLGYKENVNIKTVAFFHELGHYYTHPNFTQDQENYDLKIRELLDKAMTSKNKKIVEKAFNCYYNLPQEVEATRYAINYINNNLSKAKIIEKALDK